MDLEDYLEDQMADSLYQSNLENNGKLRMKKIVSLDRKEQLVNRKACAEVKTNLIKRKSTTAKGETKPNIDCDNLETYLITQITKNENYILEDKCVTLNQCFIDLSKNNACFNTHNNYKRIAAKKINKSYKRQQINCDWVKAENANKGLLVKKSRKDPRKFKDTNQFNCDSCGVSFSQKRTLLLHNCDYYKNHSCMYCSYYSSDKKDLRIHILKHHKNEFNFCPKCNFNPDINDDIFQHFIEKHDMDFYRCHDCNFITGHCTHLKVHIRLKHSNVRPFKCKFCKFKAVSPSSLNNHVASCHIKDKIYKCFHCNYSASNKNYIRQHISQIHLKIRRFSCTFCDFKASDRRNLESHLSWKHTDNKQFYCLICDYRTVDKYHLKRHVAFKHTIKKPHACSICSYRSADKNNLKLHIAAIHNKNKPFNCFYCNHGSILKSKIRKHIIYWHGHAFCYSYRYPIARVSTTTH